MKKTCARRGHIHRRIYTRRDIHMKRYTYGVTYIPSNIGDMYIKETCAREGHTYTYTRGAGS